MKKKLAILDMLLPIIMLLVLLFLKLSDQTVYLIIMTLFVGWVIPYFITIISGIVILKESHQRLGIIANFMSTLLLIILIVFTVKLYDKKMLIFLIEYIVLLILTVINFLYIKNYQKKHPDAEMLEKKSIKENKKKNNGAIV